MSTDDAQVAELDARRALLARIERIERALREYDTSDSLDYADAADRLRAPALPTIDGSAVLARIERIERALREYDGWFDDELRADRTSAEQAPVSGGLDYTEAADRLRAADVTAVNDNYATSASAEEKE